ncbi:hypothetical protein FRACYDRAFT_246236 [Fragilariopsis cylindrus CCMP1102]|uniref:Nucleotide-diphospho-sugar transferase domain-containing protein n=1 Tax=Fragilariopsis cylindrus CCMP1102 TaxID=635003 RepID=A0A1E7EZ65_9STRA|nr:hypothetical protein FRACYDRAFT_246236 [Fragilariopsis cylindrus CCMP1102]|eukprot:OEU11124.1 hypothetical protein FRACYDRAFT_246236 [Fragilariopsis cylindrus CCMP1102]
MIVIPTPIKNPTMMKKTTAKEPPIVISSDGSNDDVYYDQLENKQKIEQKRNNKSVVVPKSLLRSLGLILLMIIPLINEQFQTLLHLHNTSTDISSSSSYNYPLEILLGSSSRSSSSSSSRSLSTYGSVNPGADDDVVMRSSTTTKGSSSSSSRNRNSGNYYNYLNDISSKNKNNRHHKTNRNRNSHSKSNRNSKGNANQKNQKQTQTQTRQYKIVGFSDYNFKDVAIKWYARLEDLGYQEHVIIAYDNEIAEFLQKNNNEYNNSNSNRNVTDNDVNANGVAVVVAAVKTNDDDSNFNNPSGNYKKQQQQQKQQRYYRYERYILQELPNRIKKARTQRRLRKGREMMFAMRWHYILEQLQNGISILLTDVDNLFHKHIKIVDDDDDNENNNDNMGSRPSKDFYKYDVIHAYEGKSPIEIYEQIGFTVNGGMNWLQSTPYTIKFVQLLVDTCGIMCDDQIVLNHMIASKDVLDVKWDIDDGDGRQQQQQQQQQPEEILTTNKHNNGFDGLVTMSRTGRSLITNHTIKIWDRDTVFRGEANNINDCPSREKNWISMPFVDPQSKPNMSYNRRSANAFKLALYDLWDTNCGGSSSNNHT